MAPNINFNEPDLMADAELEKAVKATVAANLKKLIKQKKITQKELAEKLGVRPHHISEMENGRRTISVQMAKKIESIFGIGYKVFL